MSYMFLFVASTRDIQQDLTTTDGTTGMSDLKEGSASEVIRLMWKNLLDNVGHNVILLAGHLHSKGNITLTEENIVMAKINSRDRTAELLLTVERKGWACLLEFVRGLNSPEMKPLRDLHRKMVITMQQCGKLYFFNIDYNNSKKRIARYVITSFFFCQRDRMNTLRNLTSSPLIPLKQVCFHSLIAMTSP